MEGYFSVTNQLVSKAQDFYAIGEKDSILKKNVKVVGKTLTNAALIVAGIVETIILTVVMIMMSPLALFSCTRPNFQALKDRLALAVNSTATAAKNMCRNIQAVKIEEVEVVQKEFLLVDFVKPAAVAVGTFALVSILYLCGFTIQERIKAFSLK